MTHVADGARDILLLESSGRAVFCAAQRLRMTEPDPSSQPGTHTLPIGPGRMPLRSRTLHITAMSLPPESDESPRRPARLAKHRSLPNKGLLRGSWTHMPHVQRSLRMLGPASLSMQTTTPPSLSQKNKTAKEAPKAARKCRSRGASTQCAHDLPQTRRHDDEQ